MNAARRLSTALCYFEEKRFLRISREQKNGSASIIFSLHRVQARDAICVERYAKEIDFQSNLFSEKHPKEIAFRTTEGTRIKGIRGERDLAKNTHRSREGRF
jgi:hypothetical protein